jgi:hypothetical protein
VKARLGSSIAWARCSIVADIGYNAAFLTLATVARPARDGRRHAGNEALLGVVPERDSHSDAGAT